MLSEVERMEERVELLGAKEELSKSSSHQVSLNHIQCTDLWSTLITSLTLFTIKLNLTEKLNRALRSKIVKI